MKTHIILIHGHNKKSDHFQDKSDDITIPTQEKRKIVLVTYCNIRQNILDLKKKRGKKAISKDSEFSQEGNLKKQINSIHDEKHDDSITKINESIEECETIHENQKDQNDSKCESCGKVFSDVGDLKKHNHTVHEGHNDYKCESCGKIFSQAEDLKTHVHTIHEKQKDQNYECESCGKSFSQVGDLNRHIHRTHQGNKDYKCESCSKSFSYAHSLKKHIHTFHEN